MLKEKIILDAYGNDEWFKKDKESVDVLLKPALEGD